MLRQFGWTAMVLLWTVGTLCAQNAMTTDERIAAWRTSSGVSQEKDAVRQASALEPIAPKTASPARFRDGSAALPNDAGQIWREYDISAYTTRVTTTKRPEQAIVDWILRETGYEAWHGEPLSILSASPRTLRVYHTPKMQNTVADLVDRFVSSEAATYTFSMRVVTLDSPNWRSSAHGLLKSVPVQTPGASAWVLAKEDAAVLSGQLRRRSDYREHSSPYLMVNNGQSTLISMMRGRPYTRDVLLRPNGPLGYEPSQGQVDEGFNLDFSPLLSIDRRMIDAVIRCDVDQIEKMIPVLMDVPTRDSPHQRTKVDAPQFTHYRFCERFRWPIDQVLLVGMGMVALPMPVDGGSPLVPGLPLPIGSTPARADLLVFVECKGPSTPMANGPSGAAPRTSQREVKNYRGRY
ncbi:MAG: hypothetical protein LLF97_05290 [Planctomycetaceae bacterium]|nr:hypothetical protein [Planctomycetaceae bacterium]